MNYKVFHLNCGTMRPHGLFPFSTIHNADIRVGSLRDRFDCIILPSLSAQSILNGRSDKDVAPPYAGGIGPDGAMALERFAQQGGTLVVNVTQADLHLSSTDNCARDSGTNVAAISPFDIDGGLRPNGGGWDVGADEVGSAGSQAGRPPC